MKKISLILGTSEECQNVEKLLQQNGMEYEKLFENSEQTLPILFDPIGRYPYRGISEITKYIQIENALKTKQAVA